MIEWLTAIQDASKQADSDNTQLKALVEQRNIAKELSDLVVYCVTVPFNEDRMFCLFIYLIVCLFVSYTKLSELH